MIQTDNRLDPCRHCGGKLMFTILKQDIVMMCSECERVYVITPEDIEKAKKKK